MPRKVAKTRCCGQWTEARYFQFIRTLLRKGSQRWRPRNAAKEAVRRKNQSANKRLKWEYQCANCGLWYPDKYVVVDHIVPCGSLKSFDDLPGFVARLFCEIDGFRVLCIDCDQDREWEENGEEESARENSEASENEKEGS